MNNKDLSWNLTLLANSNILSKELQESAKICSNLLGVVRNLLDLPLDFPAEQIETFVHQKIQRLKNPIALVEVQDNVPVKATLVNGVPSQALEAALKNHDCGQSLNSKEIQSVLQQGYFDGNSSTLALVTINSESA